MLSIFKECSPVIMTPFQKWIEVTCHLMLVNMLLALTLSMRSHPINYLRLVLELSNLLRSAKCFLIEKCVFKNQTMSWKFALIGQLMIWRKKIDNKLNLKLLISNNINELCKFPPIMKVELSPKSQLKLGSMVQGNHLFNYYTLLFWIFINF